MLVLVGAEVNPQVDADGGQFQEDEGEGKQYHIQHLSGFNISKQYINPDKGCCDWETDDANGTQKESQGSIFVPESKS